MAGARDDAGQAPMTPNGAAEPVQGDVGHHRDLTADAVTIRRRKVSELVADELREMIARGRFKPGDRLPAERDLMALFRVGRPAVREALQELRSAGLVITGNGRRAVVREPDMDTILSSISGAVDTFLSKRQSLPNLFNARRFMECAMARHAALHATKLHIEQLKAALEASEAAIGDHRRYEDSDMAFHRVLFTVPDNPILLACHEAFEQWLLERWRRLNRTLDRDRESHAGHHRIFEAILMRDPDTAETAMADHLDRAWKVWEAHLRD